MKGEDLEEWLSEQGIPEGRLAILSRPERVALARLIAMCEGDGRQQLFCAAAVC